MAGELLLLSLPEVGLFSVGTASDGEGRRCSRFHKQDSGGRNVCLFPPQLSGSSEPRDGQCWATEQACGEPCTPVALTGCTTEWSLEHKAL